MVNMSNMNCCYRTVGMGRLGYPVRDQGVIIDVLDIIICTLLYWPIDYLAITWTCT